MIKKSTLRHIVSNLLLLCLTACSYNPFVSPKNPQNELTGNATGTAIGAAAGTATGLLFHFPGYGVALMGIGGGAAGYYATTQRFAAGGIIQSGGQVYSVGDYTTIEIPTDSLFESNSTDFLPGYEATLNSVVEVLKRSPTNNVLISGNTSGFGSAKYQRRISEERARLVAGYLWAHGINTFRTIHDTRMRNLTYVGYGDYFPISNHLHAESIRQNSRIQITSYPSCDELAMNKKIQAFNNIGGIDDPMMQASTDVAYKDEPQGSLLPDKAAAYNDIGGLKEESPPAQIAGNRPLVASNSVASAAPIMEPNNLMLPAAKTFKN